MCSLLAQNLEVHWYLQNLYTAHQFRRLGVATKIICVAKEFVKKRAGKLYLEVDTGNIAAISLYSQHAFKICGKNCAAGRCKMIFR